MIDIRQMVRDEMTAGIYDYHAIADRIIVKLKDAGNTVLLEALTQTIAPFVHYVQTGQRKPGPVPVKRVRMGKPDLDSAFNVRSYNAWERQLNSVVYPKGVAKRLRDCDRPEVVWLADDLRSRAHDLMNKAVWYERIAGRMSDGQTVGDIEPIVMEVAA